MPLHRPTLAGALVLLALWTAGCEQSARSNPDGEIRIAGRVEGDETSVAAKTPGRVLEVAVREGDEVRAGQMLLRLEATQAAARREQAEAGLRAAREQAETVRLRLPTLEEKLRQLEIQKRQAELDAAGRVAAGEGQLAAAQADLARAEAELGQARSDANRFRILADKGAAPEQIAEQMASKVKATEAVVEAARRQVSSAEGALEVAKAARSNAALLEAEKTALRRQMDEVQGAVRVAEEGVAASRAQLEQASAEVDDLAVTAPFRGLVVTRSVEPGQVIAPGQPLLTLVDTSQLYLRGYVPQERIGQVEVGAPAQVALDADPDRPLEGRVLRVDPETMFTPENTYFQDDRVRQVVGVKIALPADPGPAKLGMTGEARLRPGAR
ncbi:MAG: HlyD family efflux transporter periplasmic adaptor subunit [Acidobacteria bacterium]|nr:HlyD family efflux transporter periplasmic adaptor subunit [Acidobacteriota bacterium]